MTSVDQWLEARRLRNRVVHEYVRDAAELALRREVLQRFGGR